MATESSTILYSLRFTQGTSDKVYVIELVTNPNGATGYYWVRAHWGRYGGTLQTQVKYTGSDFTRALGKAADLCQEKRVKGYRSVQTSSQGMTTTPAAAAAEQTSSTLPQLLNEVSDERIEELLNDDSWGLQEKKDGIRTIIENPVGMTPYGIRRKGNRVPIPREVATEITKIGHVTIDGEMMGDTLEAFDLLEADGQDLRDKPFLERYKLLKDRVQAAGGEHIKVIPLYLTTALKQEAVARLRAEKAEGYVLKKLSAKYVPGKPNSGGNWIKVKFKASATARVARHNEARSVQMEVISCDEDLTFRDVFVGNVTIPVNHEIPPVGSLIEVEYLNCLPGGSLYQPVYKGIRVDKTVPDTYNTLKFKQAEADEQ